MNERRVVPWWRRWYTITWAVIIAGLVALLVLYPMVTPKTFYIPSEAMQPTLLKNDRVLASMQSFPSDQSGPRPLRRGDIILFNVRDTVYIKRIAALPGDRIELIEGIVHLNGRTVPQRRVRAERGGCSQFGTQATRLIEQFPGEPRPHEIYDCGYGPFDDFAAQAVRPGHVFVLGDNRDQSADSRVPRDMQGVEQVPISDVVGIARSIYWRENSGVQGTTLTEN